MKLALLYPFLFLMLLACREHECPTPIHTDPPVQYINNEIILSGESLPDAQVNSYAPTELSGPGGSKLGATAWTYSNVFGVIRSYINFDLSKLPPKSEILSAKLTLYA